MTYHGHFYDHSCLSSLEVRTWWTRHTPLPRLVSLHVWQVPVLQQVIWTSRVIDMKSLVLSFSKQPLPPWSNVVILGLFESSEESKFGILYLDLLHERAVRLNSPRLLSRTSLARLQCQQRVWSRSAFLSLLWSCEALNSCVQHYVINGPWEVE